MLFKDLDIIRPILNSLEREWYKSPTPIQEKTIPHILDWRDVLWSAQTWTGKTAAFAIPTLQLLVREKENSNVSRNIKTLILTPTRELAIQIEESFSAYGKWLPIRHSVIFWWVSQHSQVLKLKRWVDVLVATPWRLLDLMNQWFVDLRKVEIFILDEADRMLNMWFINDVKKVLAKLPTKRQTLFFSATMPKEILSLANSILTNPVKIEVAPVSSTADTVKQFIYNVDKKNKTNLLVNLINELKIKSVLVFSRTKHWADKIVKNLDSLWIMAEAIHWNKSQNARQRALNNFKTGKTKVLIATDIAARWIDIDDLSYVINYDIPNESETYVHRIGRTGRAWLNWTAITFCNQEEVEYLLDIQKLIWRKIEVIEDHPFHITIDESIKAPKKQQRNRRSFSGKRPAVANRKRNIRREKNKRS